MQIQQAISIRNKIIGLLVKRARREAKKSREQCAEFLGCSPDEYHQYEQGVAGLTLSQLEMLAYMFGVPVDCLWDDQGALPAEEPPEMLPMEKMMLLRDRVLAIRFRKCCQSSGLSHEDLGRLLGRPAGIIAQYEQGALGIPAAELETIAQHCGQSLSDFVEDTIIPCDQAGRRQRGQAELPPDVREFLLSPENAPYVHMAMSLSTTVDQESLRRIAEIILDSLG